MTLGEPHIHFHGFQRNMFPDLHKSIGLWDRNKTSWGQYQRGRPNGWVCLIKCDGLLYQKLRLDPIEPTLWAFCYLNSIWCRLKSLKVLSRDCRFVSFSMGHTARCGLNWHAAWLCCWREPVDWNPFQFVKNSRLFWAVTSSSFCVLSVWASGWPCTSSRIGMELERNGTNALAFGLNPLCAPAIFGMLRSPLAPLTCPAWAGVVLGQWVGLGATATAEQQQHLAATQWSAAVISSTACGVSSSSTATPSQCISRPAGSSLPAWWQWSPATHQATQNPHLHLSLSSIF